MKVLALLCCLVVVAQANVLKSEVHREWEKFMSSHKRTYNSEEESDFRFMIFRDNFLKVVAHNKNYEQGKTTYKMAINRFSDMLSSEVIEKMTGAVEGKNQRQGSPFVKSLEGDAPESMDWREKGAVTPVKDQAQCGSCWAFSATGSLEGQHFLKKGELLSLSEQNLMDCSWDYGNQGCNGGWMDQGFQYIVDNKGVDTEESYSYEGKDGECRFNADTVGATASGFVDLPVGDEAALKEALATVGPVSVAINANNGFMGYAGGVFKDASCDPKGLNHGVLAVGYGTENGQDYWLVKNSWGAEWGEGGYIKMARNFNNMCGITQAASYPKI